jgi:hypothetical protein
MGTVESNFSKLLDPGLRKIFLESFGMSKEAADRLIIPPALEGGKVVTDPLEQAIDKAVKDIISS